MRALQLKVCNNLIFMRQNLSADDWFINDFHRTNSMAAQREVWQMSLRPSSREQKLAQIASIKQHSMISKPNDNQQRAKK